MTAAQTVRAAVCCQTLRGEDGKREQGYSQVNTLHLSPLLRLSWQQTGCQTSYPVVLVDLTQLNCHRSTHMLLQNITKCIILQNNKNVTKYLVCGEKCNMSNFINKFVLTPQRRHEKSCAGASAQHSLPFRQRAKEPRLKEAF